VLLGFVLVFCVVYYWVPGSGGRTFFFWPVRIIDKVVEESAEFGKMAEARFMGDKDGKKEI